MTKKFKILICNDDGVHAPGIRHLWNAVKELGDCTIVAPHEQQSGKGLSISLHTPLRIQEVSWPGAKAYCVHGTPADAVKLGLQLACETSPDLIVSGVNRGSNAGRNALYSGTVGCVIEGVLRGIPGVAFSCIGGDHMLMGEPNFSGAEPHIKRIVEYVLEHPVRAGTVLNVNFPEQIRGVRWAKQGLEYWMEELEQRYDPMGSPYCWLGGILKKFDEHELSDIGLLKQGYAAVVPLQVSELTDQRLFDERRAHFEQFFGV